MLLTAVNKPVNKVNIYKLVFKYGKKYLDIIA